jgi:hypothetical protein
MTVGLVRRGLPTPDVRNPFTMTLGARRNRANVLAGGS